MRISHALIFLLSWHFSPVAAQCVEGDCKNGPGRLILPDSSSFEGDFADGEFARGLLRYSSGDTYSGPFQHRMKHGYGVYSYKNGDVFSGEFLEDMKVFGSYVYKDGSEYVGGFRNNKPHGIGSYFTSDRLPFEVIFDQGVLRSRMKLDIRDDSLLILTEVDKAFAPSENYKAPRVYALIVGIADYAGSSSDLLYADEDAKLFHANLVSAMPRETKTGEVVLLLNEAATKDKIIAAMNRLFGLASPDDYVIFYFSGHGGPGYFYTYQITGSNLSHATVANYFKGSLAKFKLCIADACFSGGLSAGGYYSPTYVNELNQERIALIMSSKPSQTSIESGNLRQGFFSYYLIQGMRGKGDLNRDSYITMGELFIYTKEMVSRATSGRQVPMIFGVDCERIPMARIAR